VAPHIPVTLRVAGSRTHIYITGESGFCDFAQNDAVAAVHFDKGGPSREYDETEDIVYNGMR